MVETTPQRDLRLRQRVEDELHRAPFAESAGIGVAVQNGTVTLSGEVQWHYQRDNAGRAVEHVTGVDLVVNAITLHPRVSATDTDEHIRRALIRSATKQAEGIHVTVDDTTVMLSGQVRSESERSQAESAALGSPHVTEVQNRLTVMG